jgi:hypothetical protein
MKVIERSLMIKDKRSQGFSDTPKSRDKDDPKRTSSNKEEALKGIPACYRRNAGGRKSTSDAKNRTTGRESVMPRLW